MEGILERIWYHAMRRTLGRKPLIAIGAVKAESARFRQTLETSREWADLILVGAHINEYECANVLSDDSSVVASRLFELGRSKEVDAIVRGQIDYIVFHAEFRKSFSELRAMND